jgi:uncharacterized protein YciI
MPLFVVNRRYGAPFDPGRPMNAQVDWPGHAVFMDALEAEGFCLLAGPLPGAGEALLVVRCESAAEVEARLAPDPWTANGILTTTRVAPWDLRIGRLG